MSFHVYPKCYTIKCYFKNAQYYFTQKLHIIEIKWLLMPFHFDKNKKT